MGKIIISPQKEEPLGPLVYLAGPVIPDFDWQSDALSFLAVNGGLDIASPRWSNQSGLPFSESQKLEHAEWENIFSNKAKTGALIFWLPWGEDFEYSFSKQLISLGTFLERLPKEKVFIGIERGHPNREEVLGFLRSKNFKTDLPASLEELCNSVLENF